MNKLFIYFTTLIAFTFVITSCSSGSSNSCKTSEDCDNGEVCVNEVCKTDETKSSLSLIAINDGDFIDGYRYDENGTLDGVQLTINAKATNFKDGTDISLEIATNPNSKVTEKLKVLDDGTSIVSFSDFTLKNGQNMLLLSGKDKYGESINTTVTITAQELTLVITSPIEGETLKAADDQNTEEYYIQKDVKVDVKGLVSEDNLFAKLVLFDGEQAKFSYVAEPKDGVAVFENVDFRAGNWKLVASIDTRANSTVSSTPVNVIAESTGDCVVKVFPENGTVINQKYLKEHNIGIDNKIPLKVESNCPANFKVKFTVNSTEIYNGILVLDGDKTVAETSFAFPEDIGGVGSEVRVDVSENFDDTNADGGFIVATYNVDTIAPNFVEVTEPLEDSILNTDTDLDGDATNGIQFWVKGKVEGSTSSLKVYIDDLENPIGGVQTYDNAIAQDGTFDTSLLDNNQYTSISVGGERTIIFEAVDEHGNKSTFNRKVNVMLSNPNELSLSFSDNKLLNPDNKININTATIGVLLNRFLEGVLILNVTLNGNSYDYTNSVNIDDPTNLLGYFSFTDLSDGRYIITPKFKDTNNFNYTGVNGYLNVKTAIPVFSNLNIVQDTDNNNILNMAKDANATLEGFQTDITIDTENLYLDDLDCENESDRVKATLYKISDNGDVLSESAKVACDGKVKFTNVTLPEGNYKLFIKVTDGFGNIGTFETSALTVDITPPDLNTLFLTATTNSNEKPVTTDSLFLSIDDKDSNTTGLQSNFKAYSLDSVSIELKFDSIDQTEDVVNGVVDFGDLTLQNGATSIELIATDNVGNITNKEITNVVVDTLVPSLELSMSKTTIDDSDDEDDTRAGIQFTVTINNMQNIEDGQVIYIQKSVDDGNGNITWNNVAQVLKDANDSKNIVITLPLGTYKLRAMASDVNNQEGYSAEIDMDVTSSNCAIVSVKKGNSELVAGTNFFNASDVDVNGNVSLIITYTASCNVLGGTTIIAKKNGANAASTNIDTSLSSTLDIPFTDGENISLLFEINSTPVGSSSFTIKVDTSAPAISRVFPTLSSITYVNANNTLIGTTGNEDKIGDLNDALQNAQLSLTVKVEGAKNGSIEMIANDGSNDVSIVTKNNIASNDENIVLSGTIADNKTHDLKFKVTDEAGNTVTTLLYNAVVDVTNPGNLATLDYDGMSNTERRKAELNLTWNQSSTDDVSKYVIKYSTSLFDDTSFENLDGTNNQEIVINSPDLTTANYQKLITSLIFQKNYTFGVRAYDEVGNASNILIRSTGTDLNLLSKTLDTSSFDTNDSIYKIKDVGDINDDGYNDVVVTQYVASGWDGVIYIFYGTGDPDTIVSPQIIEGVDGSYEGLGSSITSGDFNGDGKTDLLVGSIWADYYYDSGKYCYGGGVYVFYNQGNGTQIDASDKTLITNSNLHPVAKLREEGSYYYGKLGKSLSALGKLNGSVYDSFVLGQSFSSDGGRAFIIEGRAGKPSSIDLASASNVVELSHDFGVNSYFGNSVTTLGDLNNDNIVDVAVSDPVNKKVAIYYLDNNIYSNTTLIAKADNTGDATILEATGENYGSEIIGDIDLNNDGYKDLVVSGLTTGLFLYYGTNTGLASDSTFSKINIPSGGIENHPSWNNNFSVADLDNDNKDDIIVGENKKLNIYLSRVNNFTNTSTPDTILGESDFAVAITGTLKASSFDVNDDGLKDLVICDMGSKNCFIKY